MSVCVCVWPGVCGIGNWWVTRVAMGGSLMINQLLHLFAPTNRSAPVVPPPPITINSPHPPLSPDPANNIVATLHFIYPYNLHHLSQTLNHLGSHVLPLLLIKKKLAKNMKQLDFKLLTKNTNDWLILLH